MYNYLILALVLFYSTNVAFAQSDSTVEELIIVSVDEKAEYKGGMSALYAFIGEEVNYPKKARKKKIEGKVVVSFVVEKDGTISNATTLGNTLGYGLEEEAIRVIKLTSGNWKPAKQRGKLVKMRYRIPIAYKL